jgi:hypothetical protein
LVENFGVGYGSCFWLWPLFWDREWDWEREWDGGGQEDFKGQDCDTSRASTYAKTIVPTRVAVAQRASREAGSMGRERTALKRVEAVVQWWRLAVAYFFSISVELLLGGQDEDDDERAR